MSPEAPVASTDPTTTAHAIDLRPSTPTDRVFQHQVFAATRADEMALVDWPVEQKLAFVRQQFEAQDTYYHQNYPNATFDVVQVDGRRAGRLYVDRWPREIRVIDIALLPEFRGQGIGTVLLRRLQRETEVSSRTLSMHVEKFNRAQGLYARLGFVQVADSGVYLLIEWKPAAVHAPQATGEGRVE